ncbi:hypothetical protein TNCV_3551081 [Trichonephila clavipes]|nr:hypothetical protein TNCV_3551081 [Trichonephila clavipes]
MPIPAPLRDMISTRESNPVEARVVGGCLNSQSRAIAGRADHQYLFYPSVGVWGKFISIAGIAVVAFPCHIQWQ